jgi:transposase
MTRHRYVSRLENSGSRLSHLVRASARQMAVPARPHRRSANRARQALKLAAMSLSRSDSALGAFYRQRCARTHKPRANIAVAHKLARMVYFMLTRGEAFGDQGQQHYEEQQRQRSIDALSRRATALGFQITPAAQTPLTILPS